MPDVPFVLYIDLKPDSRIDLRVAARAAIAWADMVEDVGGYFDPSSPPTLDLLASEPGSQKIKAVIKNLAGDPAALIRTAVVSALVFIAKDTVTWTWEQVLEFLAGPDAPPAVLELSESDRIEIANDVVRALEQRVAQKQARAVYDELAQETDVIGVGVTSSETSRPSYVVPRDEFPVEVYLVEEDGFQKRSRIEEVDLVLIRPILAADPRRRWQFAWPHGRVSANIEDQGFLDRMASGALNIPMSEGITFSVELEVTEERRDTVWEVKQYSIKRVLQVIPPGHQSGLGLEEP